MFHFNESKLIDLLNEISSPCPAPGGGSVSALLLAFSGALASKVCNVTRSSDLAQDNLGHSTSIIEESIALAEKDALGFHRVVKASREKQDLEEALYEASMIPLEVASRGLDFLEITLDTVRRGNPNARTDAIIASLLSLLASQGGILNAGVNLKDMRQGAVKEKVQERFEELRKRCMAMEAKVRCEVDTYLNSIDKSL